MERSALRLPLNPALSPRGEGDKPAATEHTWVITSTHLRISHIRSSQLGLPPRHFGERETSLRHRAHLGDNFYASADQPHPVQPARTAPRPWGRGRQACRHRAHLGETSTPLRISHIRSSQPGRFLAPLGEGDKHAANEYAGYLFYASADQPHPVQPARTAPSPLWGEGDKSASNEYPRYLFYASADQPHPVQPARAAPRPFWGWRQACATEHTWVTTSTHLRISHIRPSQLGLPPRPFGERAGVRGRDGRPIGDLSLSPTIRLSQHRIAESPRLSK